MPRGGGDGTENILVYEVPLKSRIEAKRQEGYFVIYKTYSTLYWIDSCSTNR